MPSVSATQVAKLSTSAFLGPYFNAVRVVTSALDQSQSYVNAPPAQSRWLPVTAKSRIDRPYGRLLSLYHMKIIIRIGCGLVLDILFPYFISHIPARRNPIPSGPQMLTPVAFPQVAVL